MPPALPFRDVLQDLRIGARSLMRAPALTLIIVASVGLGLGVTAATFSAIDAALLRPLPYPNADHLVRIYTDTPPFKFQCRADVARLVIGHGMKVVGIGIVVGLALALLTTRIMSSLLFGVGALDASAYASAGVLLVVMALVACAIPALRAMRLQPAAILRNQ